jgi:murein DD-endopeptidase MepM/ murein hydrolase activator NlpD
MKKILILLFIIQTGLLVIHPVVFAADEATPSATIIPTETPTETPTPTQPSPSATAGEAPTPTPTVVPVQPTPGPSIQALMLDTPTNPSSGTIKPKRVVHELEKHDFLASENVNLSLQNVDPEDALVVRVYDTKGNIVDTPVQKTVIDTVTTFSISPRFSTKPGKYILKVTDVAGVVTASDFTWGVMAINTNKSVYAPDESVGIAITVLDENGNLSCDADVTLDVSDPLGNKKTLTTKGNDISANPQCHLHSFTLKPDYGTSYQTSIVGKYSMKLTATTKNSSYSILDSFTVGDSVPFTVERTTATRIYPSKTYPVTIAVTANQDFTGQIKEMVPDNFTTATLSGVKSYDEANIVSIDDSTATTSANFMSLGYPLLGNHEITSEFGSNVIDPYLKQKYIDFGLVGHDGTDFAADIGTPVVAADDGQIAYAGDGDYGTTIVIRHRWGQSYYGHLSELKVAVGDTVVKGQIVALSGNTGLSLGPHLHFGIRLNEFDNNNGYKGKINPMPYLTAASAILSGNSVKELTFNVSLKKGETTTLGYNFRAPLVNPQLYFLGPVNFYQSPATPSATSVSSLLDAGETATFLSQPILEYSEFRQWLLAADSVSFVQSASSYTGRTACKADSVTAAFPATVTQGDLVVVAAAAYKTDGIATPSAIVDNNNNSYTLAVASSSGSFNTSIWYAANVKGGGNFSVTASGVGENNCLTLSIHEYSENLTSGWTIDQTHTGSGDVLGATTGTTNSTVQPHELVFAAFTHHSDANPVASPGASFIGRENNTNGHSLVPLVTEDQLVSTQEGINADLSWSDSVDWQGLIVTFRLAPTSGPSGMMRHGQFFDNGVKAPFTF